MGTLQSVFFQPQRGIRKFNWSDGVRTRDASGQYESSLYVLDGVVSEQHRSNIKLTKHPVEYGADITDHSFRVPVSLVVKGVITNSPFTKQYLNNIPGSPSGVAGIAGQIAGVFTGERITEAYKGLLVIQLERQLLTIQTGLIDYENMILTGISTPNDITNKLDLTLTFEEAMLISDEDTDNQSFAITNSPTKTDIATAATVLGGLGLGLAFSAEVL